MDSSPDVGGEDVESMMVGLSLAAVADHDMNEGE